MNELKENSEFGCPYLDKDDFDRLVEATSDRVIEKFEEKIYPKLKRGLYQDMRRDALASLGEETFNVGKSLLVKFFVIIGFLVVFFSAAAMHWEHIWPR